MSPEAWRAAGRIARIGDLDVFYRREARREQRRAGKHGEGAGEPLVCIHGFPTSSWDFADLWPDLVSRYDVLAMDLIGLGFSAKPARPLSVALQADIVEGLCADQGVSAAHLFAHDLGDTVAQELLARSLEGKGRVRWASCTLLNGGLFPETHRPLLIQKLLLSPLGPLVARFSTERRFRASLASTFAAPPSEAFLAGSWELLVRDGGRAMLPRLIRYIEERRVHRERWVGPLVEGVVPTRLIVGALDPISGRHMAERYAELVPSADVVTLDLLGHYPHVEDPPAVRDALLAHTARWPMIAP